MSIHYLGYRKFYVKSDMDVVYLVNKYETYADCDYLQFHLTPVAFKGYVWRLCTEDNCNMYDLYDWVNQYFFDEGLIEALQNNDYTIIDEFPDDLKPLIKQFEQEEYL